VVSPERRLGGDMSAVAIYCRTSTNMQKSGLESQRRALIEYCQNRGIKDYELFEDFGVSGAKSSRPQLDKMMRSVRDRKFTTVIVYSFSRFARSTKFLIDTLEEFQRLNVNFVSLSESLDLSTPIGRAMYGIIASINALEKDIIAERVKTGMRNAKAKGKQIGRLKTRPTETILELRSKGYTYKQIAKMLNVSEGTVGNAIRDGLHKNKIK
jgi:DNA invertase Pin-like site-specific DNA recombinase